MNQDNKLISIGLPVVKPQFLEKAICCCLQQTYTNFEIIIQNNSNDTLTKEKIKGIVFSFKDTRIRYFETDYQIPMVQNWNSVLKKATGEFFALLCDDDIWEPTFLEEIISLSDLYPKTNIFHTRIASINESGEILTLSPTCPEYEDGIDLIIHRLAGQRTMYLSDFVVRTESFRQINGFFDFPDGWGSDEFTWFRLALNGGIAYSSKILFNYRVTQVNTTNSKNNKNKHKAIDLQYVILKELIENIPFKSGKYDNAKRKMLQESLKRFKEKKKKFLVMKILINKYRLSLPIAIGLSYIYQYIKRLQYGA